MLIYKPLNAETWIDLQLLFGVKGACVGCWCMWWRLKNKDYENSKGIKNKNLLKGLIDSKKDLGIIAYENNIPIGWCSVSPRQFLKRLETSKLFKQIDDTPVWCITCIFVRKDYRNKGLSAELIKNATEYALIRTNL